MYWALSNSYYSEWFAFLSYVTWIRDLVTGACSNIGNMQAGGCESVQGQGQSKTTHKKINDITLKCTRKFCQIYNPKS